MQTLKSFLDQSLLIWKDSTAAARFGLSLLVIICLGSVIGVGYWSMQPHYILLADGLDSAKLGLVADALDSANISYTYKGSNGIKVGKHQLPQAKQAVGKLGIQVNDLVLESSTPWDDPDGKREVKRRNREKEIELAIRRYESIESADVQLSIPEKQAFIRHRNAPSAAVVLTIVPGAKFKDAHAAGIAKFVASSVDGLMIDQVAISDTLGNTYSSDEALGQLSSKEEFRINRERELTQKVEWILSPMLGLGNAAVAVTTDFTFPDGTTIKTLEISDEKKAVVDETIKISTANDRVPAFAAGVAGTGSNLGSASTGGGSSNVGTETEESTFKYKPSEIERTEFLNTPILNSMTISVVVNKTPEEGALLKEKLQSLVQKAVGFREAKDEISVEFLKFVEPPAAEVPSAFALPWDQINNVLKNISLGLAAVIALLVAARTFRKIQPEPTVASELADRGTQVNQLSELVKQNPEVFSKIISSWSKLDEDETESQDKKAA